MKLARNKLKHAHPGSAEPETSTIVLEKSGDGPALEIISAIQRDKSSLLQDREAQIGAHPETSRAVFGQRGDGIGGKTICGGERGKAAALKTPQFPPDFPPPKRSLPH